jgi:hypothetical protein
MTIRALVIGATAADAQIGTGFFYAVADVNCECPIEPPARCDA